MLKFYFIGGVIGLLPLLIYNFVIFGTPFTTSHLYTSDLEISNGRNIENSIPKPILLLRLLFFPERGLFIYYPVLILSIPGFYYMYKKFKHETILFIFIFLAILIINSLWYTLWWAGSSFGPRHLTMVIPFLILPIIFTLNKNIKIIGIIFFILLIYSAFVNFASLQPKTDELIGFNGFDTLYNLKFKSFQIVANPIFDYYIPRLLEFGPRSRLIESMINNEPLDIRLITPETRDPFIPFSIGKEKEITFVTGWQYLRQNENIWMIKDGKIIVDNKHNKENNIFSFYTGANYEDKHLKIYLNGKIVNETIVPSNHSIFVELKNLPNGRNTILLQTVESCKIPQIAENKTDRRCLDIYVSNPLFNAG
jgi:hypothetical protein